MWLCNLLAMGALLIALAHRRMLTAYPSFTAYLGADITGSAVLYFIKPGTNLYAKIYVANEAICLILSVAVIMELFGAAMKEFPGVATAGRYFIAVAAGGSMVIALMGVPFDLHNPVERFPLLRMVFAVQRTVDSSLIVFLLLMGLFLHWFSVPVRRNTLLHVSLFSVYFLTDTFAFLFRNMLGNGATQTLSLVRLSAGLICLIIWVIQLKPGGEVSMRDRSTFDGDLSRELMRHLESANSALLRLGQE